MKKLFHSAMINKLLQYFVVGSTAFLVQDNSSGLNLQYMSGGSRVPLSGIRLLLIKGF